MRKSTAAQVLLVGALGIYTIISLAPILWAFLISIRQPVDAFSIPPKIFVEPTLKYHFEVWRERGFGGYFVNSAIIAISTVLISVPIGTLAGYALSRIHTKPARSLLIGMLVARMVPHLLIVIPFFLMAGAMRMIDTYPAMVLALVATNQPFTVWLMRSFFLEIPKDLDEAAYIDGCNAFQAFYHAVLPLARPGIVVTSLFSLLLAYNEFLFALVLTGSHTKTLPVAMAEYGGEDLNYWSLSAAGAIGIMLPILLFMLLFQRHLVRGLTVGAVKG